MKKQKICCVFNYPPHYRRPIYQAMDDAFDCDFFFGDSTGEKIKKMDTRLLKGYKKTMRVKDTGIKGYKWYGGCSKVFSLKYTHYLVTGEPNMLIVWLLIIWTKLTGRKLIMWTHGIHEHYEKKTTNLIYRMFYGGADVLLTYGRYNWRYMTDIGCKESKMGVIHNSLDSNVQSSIYDSVSDDCVYRNHFHNNNPTVIYIGRLQKRKKIEQMIEAVNLLKQNGLYCNVVIVGDNADAEYLYQKVEQHGMKDQVWFYGACYDEHTNARLLYNASVCVSPAAVGLTAIHAMSYGCPVISNNNIESQMPEFESIQEGYTGSLFEEDDITDLARKIKHWCGLSAEEREKVRANCRKLITEKWSVEYQIEVLRNVFK